jgi:hypothetical protein
MTRSSSCSTEGNEPQSQASTNAVKTDFESLDVGTAKFERSEDSLDSEEARELALDFN